MKKKIQISPVIILVSENYKHKSQDIHGDIKLHDWKLHEIGHLEFSKLKDENRVFVDWTGVDETYQKHGYGRLLVSVLESLVKSWGMKKIYLNALEDAVGFWKKMGYAEDKDGNMAKKVV